ncbi:MAG TPA: maleylpyruvate isomerase N-terminal domain-containing protein [Streptosporangiaceae bacterium]|jgi:uncharacterized protein (TIGR03083 family)|nr:maleylpyruvate isomerase N-terminal domain-containing protein [Streptosporangiaceae bacterium]
MTEWSLDPGLAAYRDGVTVICELAARFNDAQWTAPTPCGDWRAADVAGHLRCMADDLHEYLDDAPYSRLARLMGTGFPAATLARKQARQNAAELAILPDEPAPEHIAAFATLARSYATRVAPLWDQPHHYYRDTVVTVGEMAGVACGEWHVHAWDLARSLGMDYRPAAPDLVFDGWWAGSPQLRPPESAGLLVAAPVEAGDVWETLLNVFGRDPGWSRGPSWPY